MIAIAFPRRSGVSHRLILVALAGVFAVATIVAFHRTATVVVTPTPTTITATSS